MTAAERVRAVSYLRETKALVLNDTSELTPEQWRFKPAPSTWSPCECIGHLALVETGMLRTVQAMASAPQAPPEMLAQAAGKDDLLVRMIRSRKHKVQAPPVAHPSPESLDPDSTLERFFRVRDRSIEYMETTSDPIRTRVHPHHILGPFDGYQWMLFLCAHAERHLKQIQEMKDHPDFPR